MPTIYDVAAMAGVAPSTVSRVLNGGPAASDKISRVRAACDALGFVPDRVARRMRSKPSAVVALIISDIENPFFTSVARGVEDIAAAAGLSVVLCNSDDDLAKEATYASIAVAERVAGVIISPSSATKSDLRPFVERGIPVVAIDRKPVGLSLDSVRVANEHGAWLATSHLLDQGFNRVACITGPKEVWTAAARLQGYRKAMREAKNDKDPSLVRYSTFRVNGGYEAMSSLLDADNPPDAVFAANNLMAAGALEALLERHLIPPTVGLVAFGDVMWSRLIRPTVTVIKQPSYEMGAVAANLLIRRQLEPDAKIRSVTLPTSLEVRASSQKQVVSIDRLSDFGSA